MMAAAAVGYEGRVGRAQQGSGRGRGSAAVSAGRCGPGRRSSSVFYLRFLMQPQRRGTPAGGFRELLVASLTRVVFEKV